MAGITRPFLLSRPLLSSASAIPRVGLRSISTTRPRLLATPNDSASTSPQSVSSGPIRTPHPIVASTKDASDPGSRQTAVKEDWPDYSKGPSALDKASQLFFFTEIVRGGWIGRLALLFAPRACHWLYHCLG
jgi:NADH dehydrogenase (ubiquinone) Fe-S protein 8